MNDIQICRLCAIKGNAYSDLMVEPKILDLIGKLFALEIKSEDEFHYLCSSCGKILTDILKFYNEIVQAQLYFDNLGTLSAVEPESPMTQEEFIDTESWDSFQIKEELILELEQKVPIHNIDKLIECQLVPEPSQNFLNKNKGFTSPNDFHTQINNHYCLTCSLCGFKADHWRKCKNHMTQSHSIKSPYVLCCGYKVQLRKCYLLAHLEFHTNPEKLKCQYCSRQCASIRLKKTHEMTHRNSREEAVQHVCSKCDKTFLDGHSYKRHLRRHLPENEKEKLQAQCDFCNKIYPDKECLLNHIRLIHLNSNVTVTCDQCGKEFGNQQKLRNHYKTKHMEHEMVPCPDCGQEVKSIYLALHKRHRHSTVSKTCTICNKICKNLRSYHNHVQRAHAEPKHKCEICGKLFKQLCHLNEHRENHLNIKKFSCDQCDYLCNSYPNILKHRKLKHPAAPVLEYGNGRKMLEIRFKT